MYKTILIVSVLVALTGCRDGQFIRDSFVSMECGGGGVSLTGYTTTVIGYGDSTLTVGPISKIRPETEFRFLLKPQVKDTDPPVAYKDAWVKIESEDDKAEGNWLEAQGTYNGVGRPHTLVTCVPKEEELTKESYKYKVTVSYPNEADTISFIDPRVIVDVPPP